jgi:hypothetical protein
MANIFADVNDSGEARERPAGRAAPVAERLIARLEELSVDLRGVALFLDDSLLAASGPGEWAERAAALWRVADAAAEAPHQVHVGTGDGEVFAIREGRAAAVAVTARFPLASLMFCDLRAALRDLHRSFDAPEDG